MHRIKPAVRTETLFGNCLPLQFLYGQCVFFSTDRMEESKRITGSVCLEMWSRDTKMCIRDRLYRACYAAFHADFQELQRKQPATSLSLIHIWMCIRDSSLTKRLIDAKIKEKIAGGLLNELGGNN